MPGVQTAPARKTLEYQIGRLDSILDGLADGLHDAVTTAVQNAVTEAVREAVHKAVQEELTTVLAKRQEPGSASRYQPINRLDAALGKPATVTYTASIRQGLVHLQDRLTLGLRGVHRFLVAMWSWRWQIFLALGIGLGVGGGCYLMGPLLAVILLGVLVSGITLACLCWRTTQDVNRTTKAPHHMENSGCNVEPTVNGVH